MHQKNQHLHTNVFLLALPSHAMEKKTALLPSSPSLPTELTEPNLLAPQKAPAEHLHPSSLTAKHFALISLYTPESLLVAFQI